MWKRVSRSQGKAEHLIHSVARKRSTEARWPRGEQEEQEEEEEKAGETPK